MADGNAPAFVPAEALTRRTRTPGQHRSITLNAGRASKREIHALQMLGHAEEIATYDRPQTRGDCLPGGCNGERPCPWVSCKAHLALDVDERTGSLKLNFPDVDVWEMEHTCALDIADEGGRTLEETGVAMALTRERTRQLEVRGLAKTAQAATLLDYLDAPPARLRPPPPEPKVPVGRRAHGRGSARRAPAAPEDEHGAHARPPRPRPRRDDRRGGAPLRDHSRERAAARVARRSRSPSGCAVSAARCLPPAQVRRLVEAVRDGVRREDIVRSHGIGTTRLARIIAEHAPELAVRPPAQRQTGLTRIRVAHLQRLADGPVRIVSDPTREQALLPQPMLSRTTLAWLQARGLVVVSDTKPRVASITPAGRDVLSRGAL